MTAGTASVSTRRRRRGSSTRSRPTSPNMTMPNPEVIMPIVIRATAPATGLAVEQDHRPQSERDRPDEPDLERPEQVLEAAPEERDDEGDQGAQPRARGAPGEDIDLEHDD